MDFGIIEHILELAKRYPDLAAGAMGVFLSIMATQFFKRFVPDSWSAETYSRACQLIGFITGWLFTHGAWVLLDPGSSHFEKIYASAGCGFASPAIYSFASGWLGARYPWFNKYFGGRSGSPT